jgi:hypothetical protein
MNKIQVKMNPLHGNDFIEPVNKGLEKMMLKADMAAAGSVRWIFSSV